MASSSQVATKLLLINPPQTYPRRLADEFQSYLPIGLAHLAAVSRERGVECRIFDALAHYNVDVVNPATVRWGASDSQIRQVVEDFQPHIVGVTNPFSMFIEDALHVARIVKLVSHRIKIVLGGIEPSVLTNAERLLTREPAVDVCVVGEGEATLAELLTSYCCDDMAFRDLSLVRGIVYRVEDGQPKRTASRPFIEALGNLPFPAYDLLDLDRMYSNPRYAIQRFRRKGERCAPLHTSRGCPYKCSFCSVHSQVGYKFRVFPIEEVVSHIQYLKSHLHATHFHFEDDNLTLSPKRTVELLSAICDLGITWDTPNGIRADSITPAIAQLMAKSGATSVTIAVESGDQRVLNEIIRKQLDLSEVRKAASYLQDAGILTFAFFIIGFPGETEKEVRRTLQFAKNLSRDCGTLNFLFVATPLVGTDLERQCVNENLLVAPMNNETLISAIRITEQPLIQTKEFSKKLLLEWAQAELRSPDVFCFWSTIPVFWSQLGRAGRMAERLFDFYTVRGREHRREFESMLKLADAKSGLDHSVESTYESQKAG